MFALLATCTAKPVISKKTHSHITAFVLVPHDVNQYRSMYVYVYIYIYMYMYMYIYTFLHIHVSCIYIHTYTYTQIYIYIYIYVYIYTYIYTYTYTYAYLWMQVRASLCKGQSVPQPCLLTCPPVLTQLAFVCLALPRL